jgi:hypothetical protein
MKVASVVFAIMALLTGLWAAWKWYEASKIHPKPSWQVKPVEPTLKHMGWDAVTLERFHKAGVLNGSAARWTAFSVACSAISSILSSLVQPIE